MALAAKYQSFIAAPAQEALAPAAALHYLPSSTSVSGPTAIARHLRAQADQVKAKHNFVHAIETARALSVESETTLRFDTGGGAYLPGLDDNFLADRVVTLPVVHVVSFDEQGRLSQLRLHWDQAALLKSVGVLGSRGNNWPVAEGLDQAKTLNASAQADLADAAGSLSLADAPKPVRGGANADKHASLSLFAPRTYEEREELPANPVNPRSSAKPAPRDYYDLFGGGADPKQLAEQPPSPTKEVRNPIKSGAGKNYGESRLFDKPEDGEVTVGSPEKAFKTNPKKYDHFEFGETAFHADPSKMAKHDKHASQWDFSDFTTPDKPKSRRLPHQERHFGWSDDEDEASKPTVHHKRVIQERPTSKAQFEFTDEATPKAAERPVRPRAGNKAMGLYEDHVIVPDDGPAEAAAIGDSKAQTKGPLSNVTNTNPAERQKHFGSQFEFTDVSPHSLDKIKNENSLVGETRKKAARVMQSNWEMYDESPESNKNKGINIQGDGMGSRRAPGEKPWWEFGGN